MVTFGEPMKIELPSRDELPLKNTFVHFDVLDDVFSDSSPMMPLRQEKTCPDLVQKSLFRTKSAEKREEKQMKLDLHKLGECRPCAYYAFKKDGCRLGDDCEFCHLCDRAEIRRWKRARAKAINKGDEVVGDSRNARVSGA